MSLIDELKKIEEISIKKIEKAQSGDDLESIRVEVLGKKGSLTKILQRLGDFTAEERPVVGQEANKIKRAISDRLENRQQEIQLIDLEKVLSEETTDISLPGKWPRIGHQHILTQIIDEVTDIFLGLGYQVAEGPEVELDYYNFTALNTPPDHPARSLQDTFYINMKNKDGRPSKDDILLRTHTSPMQIRVMEENEPPLFYICPGRTFRRDVADPTHSPMFQQVEGFAVDKDITFGDLKGTLETFAKEMYGHDRDVRLRPHFFPFTEPSAEVDVSCINCDGKGCRVCSHTGWLEILGAGMIDPNVFKYVKIDPEKYSGFAFGMGVERIAMLKYKINDIRLFYENDMRFLAQF